MRVEIENSVAVDMLLDRLSHWTDSETVHRLYEQMYENYVENGCFDGIEFDVRCIVDNDFVNWCDVVEEGDAAYDGIAKLYEEQGLGDISCEKEYNGGYSFIESEYEGSFLCRW
jgi:hypothetical protein